jgi:hypothetical protein
LIRDNITNWRVFEDDEKIIKFLHSKDTFKGSVIDDEKIIKFLHSKDTFKGSVIDDEQHEALLQASGSK